LACERLRSTLRWAIRLPIATATLAALAACAPMPVADDEGHATFAREAIKLLLGRPARGIDEVEAVADIAQLMGRDVAARMLMKETEFVDTWAEVLVDLLQVQREAGNQLAGQDKNCWGTPTRPVPDPAIALWVRKHGPTDAGAPSPPWNMSDLLRSAIVIDDLSPVVLAYLFPLSMRRAIIDPSWQEPARRVELVSRILRVYLNRDLTCLRCHNPTYSASNKTDASGNVVWRRTWTIPGHAEKAVFGNYYDADTVITRLLPIMRGDVRQPAASTFGIQPWGMAQACATDTQNESPENTPIGTWVTTNQGFQAVPVNTTELPVAVGFGSINGPNVTTPNPRASLWEMEGALRNGMAGLKNGYGRFPPGPSNLPPALDNYCKVDEIFQQNCKGCHPPMGGLNLSTSDPGAQLVNQLVTSTMSTSGAVRVKPNDPANSELWQRVTAQTNLLMPWGGPALQGTDQQKIQAWINAGAPHIDTGGCNTSPLPNVDADEGFAFLTASNLVDGIWMAAMGRPLTVAHGYSRNELQRNMLWDLTEKEFLPNHWSLKTVLAKILASTWYARRAPAISQRDTAYKLPAILDPWVVADPTQVSNPATHQRYNGQGELADRFRVNTLLRNVAAALAWAPPSRFADANYPSALSLGLGQYVSPQTSGFRGINFQSLLALEAEAGACVKTNHITVCNGPGCPDWIDALTNGITVFNAAAATNLVQPITLGEAWMMVKDRLIQDPSINSVLPSGLSGTPGARTEEQAVTLLFRKKLGNNSATLNMSATAFPVGNLDAALRDGCGAVVKSPQFVLTNVTPSTYSDNNLPGPPRLNACVPGEPCGYAAVCDHWRLVLGTMGYAIGCLGRSVYRVPTVDFEPIDYNVSGRMASSLFAPGPDWSVLTRQTSTPLVPLPLPGPQTRRDPPPEQLRAGEPAFDLMKNVRIRSRAPLKGLDRVRQRLMTLCPGGFCGFVTRPASAIAQCLDDPRNNSCPVLFPPCDPRVQDGPTSCGRLPVDFGDSGVLALWAEGADVQDATGVRVLRNGEVQWQALARGAKLQGGDFVYLPLRAALRLQIDGVAFGDTRMEEAQVGDLSGHLVAVTGPSAGKLLERSLKRGGLSAAELIDGVRAGAYDTRAMTRSDWSRALGYTARGRHLPRPDEKEIREMNSHFDALHRGFSKK
jgi:hypothetical protein